MEVIAEINESKETNVNGVLLKINSPVVATVSDKHSKFRSVKLSAEQKPDNERTLLTAMTNI